MIVLKQIILVAFTPTGDWSYSTAALNTESSTALSLFLFFIWILTGWYSWQGGHKYLVGYKLPNTLENTLLGPMLATGG